ncbi:MAG: hypothetical protein AAGA85_12535 [Bacteroidota bacterium]
MSHLAKTGFFFFFFFLLRLPVTSNAIDSLEAVLQRPGLSDKETAIALNWLGYHYWIIDPVQSIAYGTRAKALGKMLSDVEVLAFANRVIGVAYWAMADYDDASNYLFSAVRQYQAAGDELGEANALMNLGLVSAGLEQYRRALGQYFEALSIFERVGAESRVATTFTKIGSAYSMLRRYDSAAWYLQEAHERHSKASFDYGIGEVLNRKGVLAALQDDYEQASKLFHESIFIGLDVNDQHGLAKNYADLSMTYIQMDRLVDAQSLLHLGVDIAQEIGVNKWLEQMFLGLRQVYELRGDYKQSLYYYDQYVKLKDSLQDQQVINNLVRFETELATMNQAQMLAEKEQEVVTNRLIAGVAVLCTIVIVLLAYILIVRTRIAARERERRGVEERERLNQELEYRNKELASYALNLAQKNQIFEDLQQEIQTVKKEPGATTLPKINNLERLVTKKDQVDRDWDDFKLRFQHIHEGFFDRLLELNPQLTSNELRLIALVKLNFTLKEIGNILGISPQSVKTARYRLKKKLNLDPENTLNEFLNSVDR